MQTKPSEVTKRDYNYYHMNREARTNKSVLFIFIDFRKRNLLS